MPRSSVSGIVPAGRVWVRPYRSWKLEFLLVSQTMQDTTHRRAYMRPRIMLAVLVAVCLNAGPSFSQVRKTGLTGAAFLKVATDARLAALGSAGTARRQDVNQVFLNPAGIALPGKGTVVSFTRNQWIADLTQNVVCASRALGDLGTLGIGVVSISHAGIQADRDIVPPSLVGGNRDFTPSETEISDTYGYSDLAVCLAGARQLTDKLSMGAGAKVISEGIDTERGTTWALDFGATYGSGFRDVAFGARLNNLGPDLRFYSEGVPLPLTFSLGVSGTVLRSGRHRLFAALDATKPQDSEQLIFTGLEFRADDSVFLRLGYKLNYSGQLLFSNQRLGQKASVRGLNTTEEGLSIGGGVAFPVEQAVLKLDYAFTQFGVLGDVHRLTIAMGRE